MLAFVRFGVDALSCILSIYLSIYHASLIPYPPSFLPSSPVHEKFGPPRPRTRYMSLHCAHSCRLHCSDPWANRSCASCGASCRTNCCQWRSLQRRPGSGPTELLGAHAGRGSLAKLRALPRRSSCNLRVLCQTATVRVKLVSDTERHLQFHTNGQSWGAATEARVRCRQSGCNCTQSFAPRRSMAECAPCPCDPVPLPNFALRGFGYVQIMIDKVVEFCGRRRNEAASATSQYRVLQIGLGGGTLAPLVRSRCGALVDVIEKQQDVADAARRFMGYAGASSGTEERLIIASAVEGMRELRARACTRQRPEHSARRCTPFCTPSALAQLTRALTACLPVRRRRCHRHRLHGQGRYPARLQVGALRQPGRTLARSRRRHHAVDVEGRLPAPVRQVARQLLKGYRPALPGARTRWTGRALCDKYSVARL